MEIFDAYVEDLIRQDKAKEKKGGKGGVGGAGSKEESKKNTGELQVCGWGLGGWSLRREEWAGLAARRRARRTQGSCRYVGGA